MTEIKQKASTIVRVLEMTMQDVRAQDIAQRLGIKHVRAIQNAHGYPNERTMLDQVRQLLTFGDKEVIFDADLQPEPPHDDRAPRRPLPTPPTAGVQRSGQARPATAPIITPTTDDLRAFLENAKKHSRGSIAYEAERILARIEKLREAIAEVDADQKRLAEIRELEKRLAELKAQKAGKRTTGEFPCPVKDCESVFSTKQGVTMHNTRVHRDAS